MNLIQQDFLNLSGLASSTQSKLLNKYFDTIKVLGSLKIIDVNYLSEAIYYIRSCFDIYRHRLYKLKSIKMRGGNQMADNDTIDMLLYQLSMMHPGILSTVSIPIKHTQESYLKNSSSMQAYIHPTRRFAGYIYSKFVWLETTYHIIYYGMEDVFRFDNTMRDIKFTMFLGIWSEDCVKIEKLFLCPQLAFDNSRFYIFKSGQLLSLNWCDIKQLTEIYHDEMDSLCQILDDFKKSKTQRLHILLQGNPGCGKTQTAYAISKYLKLPMMVGSDLESAVKLTGKFNGVVLIDEIETLFAEDKELSETMKITQANENAMMMASFGMPAKPRVKLSTLLSAFDNPFPIAKQVVVLCCNSTKGIDERILRPGRIDVRINYSPLKGNLLQKMLNDYLGDVLTFDEIEELKNLNIAPCLIESLRNNKKYCKDIKNMLIKYAYTEEESSDVTDVADVADATTDTTDKKNIKASDSSTDSDNSIDE